MNECVLSLKEKQQHNIGFKLPASTNIFYDRPVK